MEKKKNDTRGKRILEKLDIPTETFSYPRLTLTEGKLYIEGRCTVEEYGTELITVSCKNRLIFVKGGRLNLGAMNKSELLITGGICSVEIENRGRRR